MGTRVLAVVVLMGRSQPATEGNTRRRSVPYATSPSVPTPGGFRLSAVVRRHSVGLAPGPGWVYPPSGPGVTFGGHVPVDTNGRYVISGLSPGRFVRVTWIPTLEVGGLRLHQPCPFNATVTRDTELDIEVVRLDSREFTYGSPTLSGTVSKRPQTVEGVWRARGLCTRSTTGLGSMCTRKPTPTGDTDSVGSHKVRGESWPSIATMRISRCRLK